MRAPNVRSSSVNWKTRRRVLASSEQGKTVPNKAARLDCGRKRRAKKFLKSRRYGRGHGLWLPADVDQRIRRRLLLEESQRSIMDAERVSFRSVQRRRNRLLLEQARGLEGLTPLPCPPWKCDCGLKLAIDVCVRCQKRRPVPEHVEQSQRATARA
jgi:hypothetical protein